MRGSRAGRARAARLTAVAAVLAAVLAVAAGCGGGGSSGSKTTTTSANTSVSGSVKFWGIWSAAEQTAFEKVIAGFNKQYPNVHVSYTSKGDNIPTILATAIAGGSPPDMADVAQPGLVKQLVQQGHLKPITYAQSTINSNFSPAWAHLGVVNGKLYALLFKASNKSTLWYNVPVFKQAGVSAPKTWSQLLSDAKTIKASGTPAYSLCGSSGWTLSDIFENIYLRMWGSAKYDAAVHPRDQVDRPLGHEGHAVHGQDHRRLVEPHRRDERGPADRLPDLRRQGVRQSARGWDGAPGRLRRPGDPHGDQGEGRDRVQRRPVPGKSRQGRTRTRSRPAAT